jgi:hypothetical protein
MFAGIKSCPFGYHLYDDINTSQLFIEHTITVTLMSSNLEAMSKLKIKQHTVVFHCGLIFAYFALG